MDPIVTTATVDEHGLHLRMGPKTRAALKRVRPGTELQITIEKLHATRSLLQNALWWAAVVTPIADYTGYTKDETHELLKMILLPRHRILADKNGEQVGDFVMGGSTTKLNKVEFGELIEAAIKWAGETLGLVLEMPEDIDSIRRKKTEAA